MIDFNNSKKLFYTIREVASHFDVNESLLRFWESEFKEIKPRKTTGGIRQYTKEDIKTIELVYSLVKEKGLTLEGARQIMKTKKDDELRRIDVLRKLEGIKLELNELRDSLADL